MTDIDLLHKTLFEMLCDFDSFCQKNDIQYSLAYGTVLGAVRHKGFIPWDDDLDVMMTRENYEKFLSVFKNDEKYFIQKELVDIPLYFSKLRKNKTAFIENIKYRKKWAKIHQGIYIDIFPADKVSRNKIGAFFQSVFSNILISQSLFLRGYQTKNLAKIIYMLASLLFLPFRRIMFQFVTKFNSQQDFDYYCCFSGDTKKLFMKRTWLENLSSIEFCGGGYSCVAEPENYLEAEYGNWKVLPDEKEILAKVHAKIFSIEKDYKEFL